MIIRGVLSQYYAVFCANIMSGIYGMTMAWPSVSLPLLQSSDSPLQSGPITLLEASWIGSIICVGGAFGTIFFGWLVNRVGRKPTLLISSVPTIIGWLLIEFGQEVYQLLIARFLGGFASSVVFVTVPLIVSEISDKQNRGALGSLLILTLNVGTVTSLVACAYTSYHTVPWIIIGLTVLFVLGYSIVPETPKYLMIAGKSEHAIESLKHFRGDPNLTSEDLKKYSMESGGLSSKTTQTNVNWKDLCEPATKKAIIISVILMHVTVFSGLFVIATYYKTILSEAGGALPPELSSIIVAVIQFMGAYCATMSIERVGRKTLVVLSGYLSAACSTVMGIYVLLKDVGVDVSTFTWLPILCLSLHVFIAANGASPIPFVVLGEIFTQKVRGVLVSFSMFLNWSALFVMTLIFPYMLLYLKLYGTLWVFAAVEVSLITALCVLMPETKGLSIEQIVLILGKK